MSGRRLQYSAPRRADLRRTARRRVDRGDTGWVRAHLPARRSDRSRPYAPGPWAIAERADLDYCSSTGNGYDIWYPADLGAGMDRLRGNRGARAAFPSGTGEFLHNPHWSDQASTITR